MHVPSGCQNFRMCIIIGIACMLDQYLRSKLKVFMLILIMLHRVVIYAMWYMRKDLVFGSLMDESPCSSIKTFSVERKY